MEEALDSKGLKGMQMNKQKLPHYAQGCLQEPSKNDDPEILSNDRGECENIRLFY
jgi:hypothetical protein